MGTFTAATLAPAPRPQARGGRLRASTRCDRLLSQRRFSTWRSSSRVANTRPGDAPGPRVRCLRWVSDLRRAGSEKGEPATLACETSRKLAKDRFPCSLWGLLERSAIHDRHPQVHETDVIDKHRFRRVYSSESWFPSREIHCRKYSGQFRRAAPLSSRRPRSLAPSLVTLVTSFKSSIRRSPTPSAWTTLSSSATYSSVRHPLTARVTASPSCDLWILSTTCPAPFGRTCGLRLVRQYGGQLEARPRPPATSACLQQPTVIRRPERERRSGQKIARSRGKSRASM